MQVFKTLYKGKECFVTPVESGKFTLLKGDLFKYLSITNETFVLPDSELYFPLSPSKILGIGVNYPGTDGLFKKTVPPVFSVPLTAMQGANSTINITRYFKSALVEGELGVVIGRTAKNVPSDKVSDCILGYTICNDVSARDSSLSYVSNLIKKGSDGFFPIGPCLYKSNQLIDFDISVYVNDELAVSDNTKNMIYSISDCISFITKFVTLEAGDVVSMGTPYPKPKVYPGDNVEIRIENIGSLKHKIISN